MILFHINLFARSLNSFSYCYLSASDPQLGSFSLFKIKNERVFTTIAFCKIQSEQLCGCEGSIWATDQWDRASPIAFLTELRPKWRVVGHLSNSVDVSWAAQPSRFLLQASGIATLGQLVASLRGGLTPLHRSSRSIL